MKKYFMLLCAALAVVSCNGTYPYADYSFTILSSGTVQFDGFKNVPEEKKLHISGTMYIPEYIYGRKVTQIGSRAFADSGITSITITRNVTKIEDWAFYGCESLTNVVFEEPNGWKAGSSHLSLTDPHQNAVYLRSTYYNSIWQRE